MYLVIYPNKKDITIIEYDLSSDYPNHTFIVLPNIRAKRYSFVSSREEFHPIYSFSEKLSRLICADVSLDLLEEYPVPIESILRRWEFAKHNLLNSLEDTFSEKTMQE